MPDYLKAHFIEWRPVKIIEVLGDFITCWHFQKFTFLQAEGNKEYREEQKFFISHSPVTEQ